LIVIHQAFPYYKNWFPPGQILTGVSAYTLIGSVNQGVFSRPLLPGFIGDAWSKPVDVILNKFF
jgi:hypothetical protein